MKKLSTLAVMGLALGFLSAGLGSEQMSSEMKFFYEQLSPDAQQKFLELDGEHRKMALSIAEQYCKGQNECKGHREQAVYQQYNNQMQERQRLNQGS